MHKYLPSTSRTCVSVPRRYSLARNSEREGKVTAHLTDAESAVRCYRLYTSLAKCPTFHLLPQFRSHSIIALFYNTRHALTLSALAHSYPHSLPYLLNSLPDHCVFPQFTHRKFPDGFCGVSDINEVNPVSLLFHALYILMASPICQLVNHADLSPLDS